MMRQCIWSLIGTGATALFFLGAFWAAYRELRRLKKMNERQRLLIEGYGKFKDLWVPRADFKAMTYDRDRLEKMVVAFKSRSHKKKGSRYNS